MEVKSKIELALQDFLNQNEHLIIVKANERTLTQILSTCLKKYFKDYEVDCEYNRDGDQPKKIKEQKVYPDIIIHRRGRAPIGENFVVIEAKKTGKDTAKDLQKLRLYKTELGYQHAFLITFPASLPVQNLSNYIKAIK